MVSEIDMYSNQVSAQRTGNFICSIPKLSPVVNSMHLCFLRNNMEELCKTCHLPPSVLGPLDPLLRFSHRVVAKYFLHHKELSSLSWERRYSKKRTPISSPSSPLTYWESLDLSEPSCLICKRSWLVSLGHYLLTSCHPWWGLPPFNRLSSP